jgi:2-oxoglutarate dehydrogenase E1 component
VLDDEEARERAGSVERLILCSGKIYTELVGSEYREEATDTAVARIELLYPFPEEQIREVLDGYDGLREIIWVQEEPQNMGAWSFVEPRLREIVGRRSARPLRRQAGPSEPGPGFREVPQGGARGHRARRLRGERARRRGRGGDAGTGPLLELVDGSDKRGKVSRRGG